MMFVVILFLLYALHAKHYDTMDIGDYQQLSELLEDDHGVDHGGRDVENPNRLLKASGTGLLASKIAPPKA